MYTLSTKYPFYVQSNISCGEVYEIAGKLISINCPKTIRVPLHVAEPSKKYNGFLYYL